MKNELPDTDFSVLVEDLTIAYDKKPVLWDIDLRLPKGKLIAIVGPNGAGKSTLLKATLGLIKPSTGSINFGGGISRKDIGYVEQTKEIDWDFPITVFEVALMGRYGHLGWINRPKQSDKQIAMDALRRVGMADYANRQISQLSGGQQQRVFLARALAQEAKLYFMDEPFKGVDIRTERVIIDILKQIRDEGKTVIVVHHDLKNLEEYFDWAVLINTAVIAAGPTSEVFTQKNIDKAYSKINPIIMEAQG